jgi:hypothetical protein
MLLLYRRHLDDCKHRHKGRRYRHCQCPLWVQGTLHGRAIRRTIDLRSWEAGQDLIRSWESKGTKKALVTLKSAAAEFLKDGKARHLSDATLSKHRFLLTRLQAFAQRKGLS